MAKTYRIVNGFNVKIPDDGKSDDYGPGTVVQFGDAFEVRFEAGDEAIGMEVLVPLYQKMKADPYPIDLDALWKARPWT